MEVYLIRHTTPDVAKGICYGQTDLKMAETCQQEFEEIKKHLPDKNDAIYSSPLIRCRMLAEWLSNDEPVTFNDDLKEMNFGEWEMEKWDDINQLELERWMKDYLNISPPNGESLQEMSIRVHRFWDQLLKSQHQVVFVVTHAGVIKVLQSIFHNRPLLDCVTYKLHYGEVLRLIV